MRCTTVRFPRTAITDRKSTRLNSSHTIISYAVFCLNNHSALGPARRARLGRSGGARGAGGRGGRPPEGATRRPRGRRVLCAPDSSPLLFFNDTATTEIYPLSLHDALPINDTATTEIYTLSLHDASDLGGRRIIRTEERRVGEEGRYWGWADHYILIAA